MQPKTLTTRSLGNACRRLAEIDPIMHRVHELYGTPPMWDREPGFATLLHIILEQQVSLASAKACFDKLNFHIGELTPAAFLDLSYAELRKIGFSRQKAAYGRNLSEAILDEHIDLDSLHKLPDAEAQAELLKLKGVGHWTANIYMLMVLLRPDIMPRGDIALHEAYRQLTGGEKRPGSDEFITIAEKWKPYRSVAARLLWHFYLSEKAKRVLT